MPWLQSTCVSPVAKWLQSPIAETTAETPNAHQSSRCRQAGREESSITSAMATGVRKSRRLRSQSIATSGLPGPDGKRARTQA